MVENNNAFPSNAAPAPSAGATPNAAPASITNAAPASTPNATPVSTPSTPAAPILSSPRADFSSPAPADILLTPAPTKKSKKPLIISLIVIFLLAIVAVAIAVCINLGKSNNNRNRTQAFSDYVNYLENGDGSDDGGVFAISQISNNYPQSDSVAASHEAYAKALSEKYNNFRQLVGADNNLIESLSEYDQIVALLLNYIAPASIIDELREMAATDSEQEREQYIAKHFFADSPELIISATSRLQIDYFDQELRLVGYYNDAGCDIISVQHECAMREYGINSDFATTAADAARAYYAMTSTTILEPFTELLISRTQGLAEAIEVNYE